MFKVSRRSCQIRAFKRTNSHGHTTHRSKILQIFDFLAKKPTLRYLFESDFSTCFIPIFSLFFQTRTMVIVTSRFAVRVVDSCHERNSRTCMVVIVSISAGSNQNIRISFSMGISSNNDLLAATITGVNKTIETAMFCELTICQRPCNDCTCSKMFFCKKIENLQNVFDLCVVWPQELVRLKALIQEDLLDTLNIYF